MSKPRQGARKAKTTKADVPRIEADDWGLELQSAFLVDSQKFALLLRFTVEKTHPRGLTVFRSLIGKLVGQIPIP